MTDRQITLAYRRAGVVPPARRDGEQMAWGLGCLASTVASLCVFELCQWNVMAPLVVAEFVTSMAALTAVGIAVGRRWRRWGFLWGVLAAQPFWAAAAFAVSRIG